MPDTTETDTHDSLSLSHTQPQQLKCKWAVLDLIEPIVAFFRVITVTEVRLFQHEQHHFQAHMLGAVLLDIVIKSKQALKCSINLQGVSQLAAPHFSLLNFWTSEFWTKLFSKLSVAHYTFDVWV